MDALVLWWVSRILMGLSKFLGERGFFNSLQILKTWCTRDMSVLYEKSNIKTLKNVVPTSVLPPSHYHYDEDHQTSYHNMCCYQLHRNLEFFAFLFFYPFKILTYDPSY